MSSARPELYTKRWQLAYRYRRPRHGALSIEQWYDQEVHHHMAATKHEESRRYLRPVQWALLVFVLVSIAPVWLVFMDGHTFVSSTALEPTPADTAVRAHFALLTYTETSGHNGTEVWSSDIGLDFSCAYTIPLWLNNARQRDWTAPGCAALSVLRLSLYAAPAHTLLLIAVMAFMGVESVLLAALMRARYETDILSFGNEPTVTANLATYPRLHYNPLLNRPAPIQPTPPPNPPPRTPIPPAVALTAHYLSYQQSHQVAYRRRLLLWTGWAGCVAALWTGLAVSCGVWVTNGGFVDREVGWPAWLVMVWAVVCGAAMVWVLVAVRRLHGAVVEHVEDVKAMAGDAPALYQHVEPSIGMEVLRAPLVPHDTML